MSNPAYKGEKSLPKPRSTARDLSEAFLLWARRSALPLPAVPEEPLNERAQAALDRMLAGKRFVFLGEPDHFIVEKYPFRLLLIQHLFGRGWRHVGMETGRSVGWCVDRYLETGDASQLHIEPASLTDMAIHDKALEFIDRHEDFFHGRLRHISESRAPGTARLHYWGYDFDLGVPLASIRPIQCLLEGRTDNQVQELLSTIDRLWEISRRTSSWPRSRHSKAIWLLTRAPWRMGHSANSNPGCPFSMIVSSPRRGPARTRTAGAIDGGGPSGSIS